MTASPDHRLRSWPWWPLAYLTLLLLLIYTSGSAQERSIAEPRSIDPVTITLIGGMVVTVIGSIVTGAVAVITALRVGSQASRLDSVAKDTEAIKGHVNSEKTAAEGREITLRKENELLREMIADKKTTADLLAQAAGLAAMVAAQPGVAPPPISVSPAAGDEATVSLKKIAENTAETAKNTAKTGADVQELKDKA